MLKLVCVLESLLPKAKLPYKLYLRNKETLIWLQMAPKPHPHNLWIYGRNIVCTWHCICYLFFPDLVFWFSRIWFSTITLWATGHQFQLTQTPTNSSTGMIWTRLHRIHNHGIKLTLCVMLICCLQWMYTCNSFIPNITIEKFLYKPLY